MAALGPYHEQRQPHAEGHEQEMETYGERELQPRQESRLKDQMVHRYGDVDVIVVLTVGANPVIIRDAAGADDDRCRVEPLSGIGGFHAFPFMFIPDHYEAQGLAVGCGGGRSRSFQQFLYHLLIYGPILVITTAVPSLSQLSEIHGFLSFTWRLRPSTFRRYGERGCSVTIKPSCPR